ncbi:glycosyltransferase family 4 protein [Pelagibius litoralis]|uniref:Glycosyltransferase family 4 protein n=1 Tax=Pelagibius litoralis TaxID=374515 RepID=A0A967F0R5_9PROT|nr:glycosyltransferase family 4 protein [Pelagibius litoralis]
MLGMLLVVTLSSWAASGAVLRLLQRWQVFDQPNHRSSHEIATPRGGGLAVVPVIVLAWIGGGLAFGTIPTGFWPLLGGLLLLAAVSWLDDLRSLPAGLRLAVQITAVALGLWGSGGDALIFGGILPALLDHLIVGLLWIWFINLFNFMDGIDGITAVESVAVAGGIALCAALASLGSDLVFWSASLAAAALGFVWWNWAPARIFLGDVGSVPLGYLLGWLLILLAGTGQWAAALILPLYYLADATWTLGRRALRGEALWRAHREHFYQQAVQRGFSHAAVSSRILVCNMVLAGLALAAVAGLAWPVALGLACLAVAVLLFMLAKQDPPAQNSRDRGENGSP